MDMHTSIYNDPTLPRQVRHVFRVMFLGQFPHNSSG